MALQANVPGISERVACIIDADLDRALDRRRSSKLLILTDYASIEMYAFTLDAMSRFWGLYLDRFPDAHEAIFSSLVSALTRLFCYRLANARLDWQIGWPKLKGIITESDGRCSVNDEEFCRRFLSKGGKIAAAGEFMRVVQESQRSLPEDWRHSIYGSDLIEAMAIMCSRYMKDSSLRGQKAIKRTLFVAMEISGLEAYPLFKELLRRYSAPSGRGDR